MKSEEMEKRRKLLGYSYAEVAEMTGIDEKRVREVLRCEADHLYLEDAFALEVAVTEPYPLTRENVRKIVAEMLRVSDEPEARQDRRKNGYIRETPVYQIKSAVRRKRQGEYTIADYKSLPDETMPYVEMINGVFIYARSSPTPWHQLVLQEIMWTMDSYIKKNQGTCFVFVAPVDVYIQETKGQSLSEKGNTFLKPDGFIVCNRENIRDTGVMGAPDFIVEVLSKSTRRNDLKKKKRVYQESGVREYWMVDMEHEKIIVYCFEDKSEPVIYGFDDEIPVGIYNRDLKIHFQRIHELLKRAGYQSRADKG